MCPHVRMYTVHCAGLGLIPASYYMGGGAALGATGEAVNCCALCYVVDCIVYIALPVAYLSVAV